MHNPLQIFNDNWQQAKAAKDANANYCSLATVSASGEASIRTLVLREVTDETFTIFINNTSPKWKDLFNTGQFELLVFWPSLMQQYRVRGAIELIPEDEMRGHWARKPYTSKIIDHFYTEHQAQSSVVDARETILSGINALQDKHPDAAAISFPENARGVRIKANYLEVWHGSAADRLHERYLYLLQDGEWAHKVLVP